MSTPLGGPCRRATLASWAFFTKRLVPAFSHLNTLLRAFALCPSAGSLEAAEGILHMVSSADMSLQVLRDDQQVTPPWSAFAIYQRTIYQRAAQGAA